MLPRKLIDASHRRQIAVHRRADHVASAVDAPILQAWHHILGLLERGASWPLAEAQARRVFQRLVPQLFMRVATDLHSLARWSAASSRKNLADSLSLPLLKKAAAHKLVTGALTLEREDFDIFREELSDFIFPAPDAEEVRKIIYAGNWVQRLSACTRLAPPEQLAGMLAAGIAAGRGHREIARQIAPLVQNVRSSAKRVARTESLRVAGAVQMQMHEQLGDLVVGYTIHSAHFPDSRSWHVARAGTCYYKNPQPGQKGYSQMPRPPHEADDVAERPPNTPQIAWNCLCFLTPILR